MGKTTTVFEIGALLAEEHHKKVLLIDLDPQCSLSKVCCKVGDTAAESMAVEESFNYCIQLYMEYVKMANKINILEDNIRTSYSAIRNAIKHINKYSSNGGKLDFISTVLNIKNSKLNDIAEKMSKDSISILAISKMLEDICRNNEYNYILFDCPPTSNTITQSVYLYSDYYLIPTIIDEISCGGVGDYITEVQGTYLKYVYDSNIGGIIVKKYFGNKPKLIGALRTMVRNKDATTDNQLLINLDNTISKFEENSLITNTVYVKYDKRNIFDSVIRHLNNRSDPKNYGLPITVSNGEIHDEYKEIAKVINAIV